jgi:prepilin-type N-terminal cleavage/methylation domain-containing protein
MTGKMVMDQRGFTLVELLMAITVMAILLSIGTFQFNQQLRKSAVENQTRILYGDIVQLRSKALFEKRSRALRLSTTGYSLYSSGVMSVGPADTRVLKAPLTWSGATTDVTFDTSGTTNDNKVICTNQINTAAVDSIVISTTRIRLGKLNQGAACAEANIVAK